MFLFSLPLSSTFPITKLNIFRSWHLDLKPTIETWP